MNNINTLISFINNIFNTRKIPYISCYIPLINKVIIEKIICDKNSNLILYSTKHHAREIHKIADIDITNIYNYLNELYA